jgi:flagellin
MSSINTNVSAKMALQALTAAQATMVHTENRVATGFRVATAQDNAAYWSIATTMRSDTGALSAVNDALGLGAATANVAHTGLSDTIKLMDKIKQKLVAAREPGVDRTKIQNDISSLQAQMRSVAQSASFSGQNWLNIDSSAGVDNQIEVVSSFSRDSNMNPVIGTITFKIYTAATGETMALFDTNPTASAKAGLMDRPHTAASGATYAIETLNISPLTDSAADLAELDSYIQGAETTMLRLTDSATSLGYIKTRIEMQKSFVSDLMATVQAGVGRLVDADMDEESTRLQALQTKQALGVQSLSIANQSSETMLKLFQQ